MLIFGFWYIIELFRVWFLIIIKLFSFFTTHKAIFFNFKLNVEKFFEDENTCDIFMNEVRMEDEPLLELE